jgi:hypothetical protein
LIPNELTRSGARSAAMTTVAFGRLSRVVAERFITVTPAAETPAPTILSSATPGSTPIPGATSTPAATQLPPPSVEPTIPPTPPDRCLFGFVWREAFAGDHTCVTPDERQQVQIDNQLAAIRIDPFGAYGPDTCVVPYVWRGIVPEDHVCVTPVERQRVIDDNVSGPSRIDLLQPQILR